MQVETYRFTDAVGKHGLCEAERAAEQKRRQIERQVKAACADVSTPSRQTEKCAANYRCRLQGEIAERAMKARGGESLNETYGRNFPVYDHRLGKEWASVKTHMPGDAHPTAYLDNYAHDLRVAAGETVAKEGKYKGWRGTTFAAGRVARDEPGGDAVATRQRIKGEMEQHATIRIPSDHVEAVRRHVWYAAQDRPDLYGLPGGYDRSDLECLVYRVQPLPITSAEIRRAVDEQLKRQGFKV